MKAKKWKSFDQCFFVFPFWWKMSDIQITSSIILRENLHHLDNCMSNIFVFSSIVWAFATKCQSLRIVICTKISSGLTPRWMLCFKYKRPPGLKSPCRSQNSIVDLDWRVFFWLRVSCWLFICSIRLGVTTPWRDASWVAEGTNNYGLYIRFGFEAMFAKGEAIIQLLAQ